MLRIFKLRYLFYKDQKFELWFFNPWNMNANFKCGNEFVSLKMRKLYNVF